jgi:hypothetical protein
LAEQIQAAPAGNAALRENFHRLRRELEKSTLVDDALFFYAAALHRIEPTAAAPHLIRLLKRKRWLLKELRAGGQRLRWLAQAAIEHGLAEAALAALPADEAQGWQWIGKLASAARWIEAGQPTEAAQAVSEARASGAPEEACATIDALCRSAIDGTVPANTEGAAPAWMRLASRPEPGFEDLIAFVREEGPGWVERCPFAPERIARRVLSGLCDKSRWKEALELAKEVDAVSAPWAAEAAALTRARVALGRALAGDYETAETELERMLAITV